LGQDLSNNQSNGDITSKERIRKTKAKANIPVSISEVSDKKQPSFVKKAVFKT